jgi:hypothetical protein
MVVRRRVMRGRVVGRRVMRRRVMRRRVVRRRVMGRRVVGRRVRVLALQMESELKLPTTVIDSYGVIRALVMMGRFMVVVVMVRRGRGRMVVMVVSLCNECQNSNHKRSVIDSYRVIRALVMMVRRLMMMMVVVMRRRRGRRRMVVVSLCKILNFTPQKVSNKILQSHRRACDGGEVHGDGGGGGEAGAGAAEDGDDVQPLQNVRIQSQKVGNKVLQSHRRACDGGEAHGDGGGDEEGAAAAAGGGGGGQPFATC